MSNETLKSALGSVSMEELDDIELTPEDLDDIAGGACTNFTCGWFAPD